MGSQDSCDGQQILKTTGVKATGLGRIEGRTKFSEVSRTPPPILKADQVTANKKQVPDVREMETKKLAVD
jgi:hypothetical protein